ncbi:MBL fold metallo-hydrolase [Paraburkholderia sp. A2WS-5]|uniref:MBL fold metallo-hydrolase n=1 Tax=unclassified Paraburkholderia TaxID=2615204 RepID=UPI003B797CC7
MESKQAPNSTRRALLGGLAMAAGAAIVAPARAQSTNLGTGALTLDQRADLVKAALRDAKGTKLVILGTGAGPIVGMPRHQTSHVMVHNGSAYVVDFGLGVSNEFARTGLKFEQVRAGFLTHHHPDHNIEYGPFLLLSWIYGMNPSAQMYGPPPLNQMTQEYIRSQASTIQFWAEDFKEPPLTAVKVNEFSESGLVMTDENVRVSAVRVEHPPVNPAFGYRFDFHDRSIAFSGDTVPLEAVAQMAKGADILVHEAMNIAATQKMAHALAQSNPKRDYDQIMHHMMADHSPVEEVGRIAQEAGVKTLILSHLTPVMPVTPDAEWRNQAAKHFKGEIIVGYDLMVI